MDEAKPMAEVIEYFEELRSYAHANMPSSWINDEREARIDAALAALALTDASDEGREALNWAVGRWQAEVANRPLVNIHRRSLDDARRQMVRHFGGDDEALLGPSHDELLRAVPPSDSSGDSA